MMADLKLASERIASDRAYIAAKYQLLMTDEYNLLSRLQPACRYVSLT